MRREGFEGAERRARRGAWYEENSPGQIRTVDNGSFPIIDDDNGTEVPILEVRDFGRPLTVTLQLDKQFVTRGPIAPLKAYGLRAKIVWGCGGASDFFECDWAEGGLVNLVAQRLTVTAKGFQSDPTLSFFMGADVINLSAAVGHGNAEGIHPFYSVPLIAAAGASSPLVRPPAWARALSVMCRHVGGGDPYNPTTNPWHLDVTRANAVPYARFDNYSLAAGAAIPISSDSFVSVANTHTSQLEGTLLFHIGA